MDADEYKVFVRIANALEEIVERLNPLQEISDKLDSLRGVGDQLKEIDSSLGMLGTTIADRD